MNALVFWMNQFVLTMHVEVSVMKVGVVLILPGEVRMFLPCRVIEDGYLSPLWESMHWASSVQVLLQIASNSSDQFFLMILGDGWIDYSSYWGKWILPCHGILDDKGGVSVETTGPAWAELSADSLELDRAFFCVTGLSLSLDNC
ncbi:hypothetical protein V6N11_029311 [Hibiscus sabdariffa]|uniref:Uncharacterized protein n=1 Tax=Hibiscus sabdariffa TaxID=183260 RepID=A0ABR2NEK8_9ROSI